MARGKGGGPHTKIGKENSSKNSLKHGMRAKKIQIMADESEADFERVEQLWKNEWQPEGYKEERLVEILIHNDWLLKRGFRRAYEALDRAAGKRNLPRERWTEGAKENVDRMLQYKDQAERAFYRSLNALERLKKDLIRMEEKHLKLLRERDQYKRELEEYQRKEAESQPKAAAEVKELTPAQKLFAGQLYGGKKIAKKKIKVLNQWVSVHAEEGKTVTTLYPPNQELIERGQKMWPPPELVYRTFDFRCPVPKEYEWAVGYAKSTKQNGGVGIQRMTADEWLKCIEREKHDPHGHVGPTEVGNLPRPRERGGCDCPSCTNPENLKLLEEWEKKRAA